ncbi:MAG: sulfur carrier protein ThiS [Lentisphaeria bacterium]|nr:sulfur carrier protein ThiS [Lentisphaeria bacterium]
MSITLNGETVALPESQTLASFIEAQGYAGQTFAVALNESFVPKAQYQSTQLQAGDNVEIVAPMQGG